MDRERYQASPGAWEFLEAKHRILAEYDSARRLVERRPVKTEHGNVAEASLRGWLEGFLPRKFGVCRGYIIESWAKSLDGTGLRHHDVIIYDALNAPTLWVDGNDDVHANRRNRAIPARHVMSVFEVKSRLNAASAADTRDKLSALNDIAGLHPSFCSGFVFIEIDPAAEPSPATLDNLMPGAPIVGLFGGVVLRGNGISADLTGQMSLRASPQPSSNPASADHPLSNDRGQWNGAASVAWATPAPHATRVTCVSDSGVTRLEEATSAYHSLWLTWSRNAFAAFAFNLLDRLEGRSAGPIWSKDAPLFTTK